MVKSITNEFLEMTYPDQYYKDVIEPAKTGKGPMPSKMQMLSKSQPFKALSLPFREMMNPGSYGAFRSSGTPMASRALGLGRTALGGPFGLAALTGQGLGMAADKYAQATNTPEAYEYMKSMGGVNSLGNFDETNLDVGDIYSEIDRLNQPQTSQPMGTDVIGMDEMNTYGQVPMGTDVIGMDEMNTYDNRDFTNVGGGGGGGNKPDVEQEEYLETPSKFQNFKSRIDDGLGSFRNKASQGWDLAQKLPGMAMGAMSKIPGIGMALGALGNSFEDRQLTGDGTIVDEYGRSYTADELNSQNALGGWYTDAARSSRRRNKSVQKMLARQKKESLSRLGAKRLAKLQAQQALENANRLSATKTLAAQNKAAGTGGYQSSFGKDAGFMGGSGTSADMGSFRDGGLATLFARRG